MRAVRLFSILDQLRGRRQPVSAETLADHLNVSVRTIYRDIVTLQSMGAPVRGGVGVRAFGAGRGVPGAAPARGGGWGAPRVAGSRVGGWEARLRGLSRCLWIEDRASGLPTTVATMQLAWPRETPVPEASGGYWHKGGDFGVMVTYR